MSEAEERLVTRMKEVAPQRGYSWIERLAEEELARAEAMLGFPLPPLLRRVYLEVGKGAFGLAALYEERAHGLEMPLVDRYLELRSDQKGGICGERRWPENLLIMYDWGCNRYSCLDCGHTEYRVVRNDHNRDHVAYALEAPSLQQWLQALLDDTLDFDWDTTETVTL